MLKKLLTTFIILFVHLFTHTSAYGVEKRVIIGFHQEPGSSELVLIESKQGRVKQAYRNVHALAVEIEEGELAGLRDNPGVAYIEEDMQIQAIDPVVDVPPSPNDMMTGGIEYDNAWSVSLIGSEVAHSQSVTGAGVHVAILDTGMDYNHPDLDLNYSGGDNFISLDVNNHDPMDDSFNSHGTHVAGIVAAELDGVGVVGVAPNVSIYAVKVLDGAGFGSVSAIISGIDWAIANQMDIVNMSMGIGTYSQALYDACAAAEAAGILLVAAAGNTFGGPILYPAAFPSVIAVGATTIFGEISPLSPIGPEMEIVAPGLNVYSTVAGNGYGYLGGTSQAAPHVTGLAALLLSAGMVDDMNGDGLIDNHDTRLMIQDSSIDLGDTGYDEIHGYGLVDVAGPFSGYGNPVTHLTIERLKDSHWNCDQEVYIEDGIFDVTIVNTSLKALKMAVYEGGELRRDLTKKFKFKDKYKDKEKDEDEGEDEGEGEGECKDEDDDEDDEQQSSQELNFILDATGTAYTVKFIPFGKRNTIADVYIQKQ